MLFRLTVLLAGGLFLAMYFAPDGQRVPRATEPQAQTSPAPDPFAQGSTEQTAASAPASGDTATDTGQAAPERDGSEGRVAERLAGEAGAGRRLATDQPAGRPDASSEDAPAAAQRLEGLSLDGLSGGDAAAALQLSERIRQRVEEERAAAAEAGQGAAQPTQSGAASTGAAPPAPAASDGDQTDGRALVVATAVNLRSGPSTQNPVIGRVDFGDEVVLLGEAAPGWSQIRHPETGEPAFMASRFLQELGN